MGGIGNREHRSHEMGMHSEQLRGRTQQVFFQPGEEDNFLYPDAFDVDFNKRAEFDAAELDSSAINLKIRDLIFTDNFPPWLKESARKCQPDLSRSPLLKCGLVDTKYGHSSTPVASIA